MLHLDRCQHNAQRIGRQSEHSPHEEVPNAHQCGQPGQVHLACFADCLTVAPQHGEQGRHHHCYHHHNPHAKERCRSTLPCLLWHSRPRHRHCPSARHRHSAHCRHGSGPDNRHCRTGNEERRRDTEESSLSRCTHHGGATTCRSRCVLWARGRATGTCPKGR